MRIKLNRGQRIAAALTTLLLLPSIGRAQNVSFVLYVGAPLSNLASADTGMAATTGRYTFGPALQVGLSHGFNLEADLLYKRFAFGFASDPARLTVHRLELPLLLRYNLRDSRIHPFVQAGMSLNRVIAVGGSSSCVNAIAGKGLYCIVGEPAVQLRHRHTHGFVVGAGMDLGRGTVRLRPELMITEWVDRNFGTKDSILRSNLTQVELLLGLKF
jgi:hypothetical protein